MGVNIINKKIGVFIPGRLSSERLPNKLILPLGSSCLWEIACRKLNDLPIEINKYVLCCDKKLIQIASKYKNIKIIERDIETAHVDSPLNYIFKELKNVPDTHLMFLNPCLSLLSTRTILNILEDFASNDKDYATSVKGLQNWLFNCNGNSLNKIDYQNLTTKEILPIYQAAHCFHIFHKDNFFKDGMMLKPNHGIYEIPAEETIDIDTEEDYKYAQWRHSKKYVIDLDNTLCITNKTDYANATPIKCKINMVNHLYEAGNFIVINTARGYESKIDLRDLTEYQLKIWGLKYHALLFNKPAGDVYIDDKALNVSDWNE